MRLSPLGIGIAGPGLADWESAAAVLRGDLPYLADNLRVGPPVGLSPNERRRSTLAARLGLAAARQATSTANPDMARLCSVFASADGDMALIDSMCCDIYERHVPPSPTVFQNSVHNAVAGYWSIAERCQQPSTSIAAGDGSFAAGLLEAAAQMICSGGPILLVAFDVPGPEPLHAHRPHTCPFACALLLGEAGSGEGPLMLELDLRPQPHQASSTPMKIPELEAMRLGNPAARALPMLAAIASGEPAEILLPYWSDLRLAVSLSRHER